MVLVITGAEALYADMGHFGRSPIRRAWFFLVFPALTINYLGQAALVLHHPAAKANPFFLLIPEWGRLPVVILATAATVIASQAVISGAFSLSRQAVQLGLLPPLTIRQTSKREGGQIYLPAVNVLLFIGVMAVMLAFGSSDRLSTAYGISVTGALVVDTLLLLLVARPLWHWEPWKIVLAGRRLRRPRAGVPRRQPLEDHQRRVGAAAHRRGGHHPHDDLAPRPAARSGRPEEEGRVPRRVHRGRPQAEPAAGARDRDLPAPEQGQHAARAARERGAQPRPARARHHRLGDHGAGAARADVGGVHATTTSATRTTASST